MKILRTIALLLAASPLLSAGVIFTVYPVGGALTGYAGQTDLGWGFTLANDVGYVVVTSADYITGASLGTFSDFISTYQFIVVGPAPESPSVTQDFDAGLHTGVGSFVIDPGLTSGHSDGVIRITYDLYSVSPNDVLNFDPTADLISSGNLLTAAASIDVVPASDTTSVPEPSAVTLAAIGLAAGVWKRARQAATAAPGSGPLAS